LKDKRQNVANLMYHYKNNKYLNIIFIFTHIIYGLAFINFICQGLPIFQKYSVHIFDTIIFTLIIDFLAVLLPSYAVYSNANPTQPFSNLFHLHGPSEFGVLGAVPNSEIHLIQIDHIRIIYPHNKNIGLFLDPNNIPNLSITKYRIHSDPTEYIRWRNAFLPIQHRPR
jgi:hypothetical protein